MEDQRTDYELSKIMKTTQPPDAMSPEDLRIWSNRAKFFILTDNLLFYVKNLNSNNEASMSITR